MSNTSLCAFVSKVRSNNRIRFGDLRRLQRDVVPNGLSKREHVEALLDLDRSIERADDGWPAYLATLVKDFVLSSSVPPGSIDRRTAEWLVSRLMDSRPVIAHAIARSLVLEAHQVDGVLRAFAHLAGKRRAKVTGSTPIILPAGGGRGIAVNELEASFSFPWRDVWICKTELMTPRHLLSAQPDGGL
jgi:hypothetical protein